MNIQQVLLITLLAPFVAGLVVYKALSSITLKNPNHQYELDLAITRLCILCFLYPFIGGIVGMFMFDPGSPNILWFLASFSASLGFCFLPMHESDKRIKERERRTVRVELDQTTFDALKSLKAQSGTPVPDLIDLAIQQNLADEKPATSAATNWQFLEEHPDSGKKQLFVKGRKLPAAVVWTNTLTIAADNWDLEVEAVEEIIAYCNENRALLEQEAQEEKEKLEARGIRIEPPNQQTSQDQ